MVGYHINYLLFQVTNTFGNIEYSFALYCRRDKSQEIVSSNVKTIASYGLNHGDMIYLSPTAGAVQHAENETGILKLKNGVNTSSSTTFFPSTSSSMPGSKIPIRSNVEEDQVDVLLQKMDGTVKRKRDPKK